MILKVLGAFIAIFSFAVLLETPKKYLWCAGTVGAIGWLTFLISQSWLGKEVLSSFISAVVIAIVSHVFARIFKAPVTLFFIAGILPIVPGAGMYRAVYFILTNDNRQANFYLMETLKIAGVIALAIFIIDTVFRILQQERWKKKVD